MGDDRNVNNETYGREQPQNQYNVNAQDVPSSIIPENVKPLTRRRRQQVADIDNQINFNASSATEGIDAQDSPSCSLAHLNPRQKELVPSHKTIKIKFNTYELRRLENVLTTG
ncbi:uncharacterized protein EAF01_010494 [Botrytis porri]|uniref:uncharacterized protein n=1 Tax=Botrytis porri TaxID=87229 RepID=UPI0019014F65|nr:uncharacterized protein EAF01_010494 [Botrytis porri]KAF7892414.1 hypothetical protein EAF01_010494 [Botrytis porri]